MLQRYDTTQADESEEVIEKITDIESVIERLTQQLVDEGIVITVEGPEMSNLTITDLPGLVRTASDNEDKTIIARVRDLVNRYLDQKRTIILAVCPANVDVMMSHLTVDPQQRDLRSCRKSRPRRWPNYCDHYKTGFG